MHSETNGRLTRRFAARLLLGLCLLAAAAASAQAQGMEQLVRNFGQLHSSVNTADTIVAQAFTTGSARAYELYSVRLFFGPTGSEDDDGILVRIAPDLNGQPDLSDPAEVISLTGPTPIAENSGGNIFRAPRGTELSGTTTYHVVVTAADGTGTIAPYSLRWTAGNGQTDAKGDGWSIANNRNQKQNDSDSWGSRAQALLIRIDGRVSSNARLSGLALSNAADDSAIAFSPRFLASRTSYAATVAKEVTRVTVAPATEHIGATVAWLNASNSPLTDADTNKDGFQVDLPTVGANPIRMRVTAGNGTTRLTYNLTVTRRGSSDATLSGLALTNAADDSAIALSPGFSPSTMIYRATAGLGGPCRPAPLRGWGYSHPVADRGRPPGGGRVGAVGLGESRGGGMALALLVRHTHAHRRTRTRALVGMRVQSFAAGISAGDLNLGMWKWNSNRPVHVDLIDEKSRLSGGQTH